MHEQPHQPVPQHFGITVEAGYSNAPAAVHHVVTLNAVTINGTLDGSTEPNINPITSPTQQTGNPALHEQTPDPGEWVLYAQVNGQWRQLDPSKLSATPSLLLLGLLLDLPLGRTQTLKLLIQASHLPSDSRVRESIPHRILIPPPSFRGSGCMICSSTEVPLIDSADDQ